MLEYLGGNKYHAMSSSFFLKITVWRIHFVHGEPSGLLPSTDDPIHCANKATLRGPEIQCVIFIIIIIIIIIIEESCWVWTASALQIYEAQPEISSVFRTREFIPLPRLVAMIMVTSLPPVCSKTFFTAGLTVRGAHRRDPHNMHSVQSLSS